MANITVTVPASVLSGLREHYSDAIGVDGMTDRQVVAHHIREGARTFLRGQRRRARVAGAVSAEESTRAALEAALETERAGRVAAERASDDTADADLAGVS